MNGAVRIGVVFPHRGWRGPYDVDTTFLEPFVLFGYVAALTSLELVTSIVILPQRQTALVAKQAATLDFLCDGRLRIGVGLGWNAVEYEALGKEFSDRGERIGEQVELLRALWTQRSVTFNGKHETVTGAGIAPLPIQRPISLWFGGSQKSALRRIGRLADGWFPVLEPGSDLVDEIATIHEAAVEAGRDPSTIGIEGRINMGDASQDTIVAKLAAWRGLGATHVSLNTMGANLASVDEHISALAAAASVVAG
jgi:probable F420-dependent oxidoreductase